MNNEELFEIKADIAKLKAVHEIQNLMGKYSYFHTAHMHEECLDLFVKKTPGLRIEMAWGVYEGEDAAYRCYMIDHNLMPEEAKKGCMYMHTLTTPVIEVAGDGKTAKAIWISPGHETNIIKGRPEAAWAWLKYGADFALEDGKWKIWHLHVYGILIAPYYTSWADVDPDNPLGIDQRNSELEYYFPRYHNDQPSTGKLEYTTDSIQKLQPVPPEPYENFDPETAY